MQPSLPRVYSQKNAGNEAISSLMSSVFLRSFASKKFRRGVYDHENVKVTKGLIGGIQVSIHRAALNATASRFSGCVVLLVGRQTQKSLATYLTKYGIQLGYAVAHIDIEHVLGAVPAWSGPFMSEMIR